MSLAGRVARLLADLAAVIDLHGAVGRLRRSADAARLRRRARRGGGRIGTGVLVVAPDRVDLGPGVQVQDDCVLHAGGQDWSFGAGGIALGARAYLGHRCVLYGAGQITLEDDVLVGPGVLMTSQGHRFDRPDLPINVQPHHFAPVRVCNGAGVGAGAILLPGVTVGEGAVVAAGAVVRQDVPARAIVAGVPARVVRHRAAEPVPRPDGHAA